MIRSSNNHYEWSKTRPFDTLLILIVRFFPEYKLVPVPHLQGGVAQHVHVLSRLIRSRAIASEGTGLPHEIIVMDDIGVNGTAEDRSHHLQVRLIIILPVVGSQVRIRVLSHPRRDQRQNVPRSMPADANTRAPTQLRQCRARPALPPVQPPDSHPKHRSACSRSAGQSAPSPDWHWHRVGSANS